MYNIIAFAGLLVFSSEAQRSPGDVFRDCADCPEMVVVPSGSFMMGSHDNLPNRIHEIPLHQVTINKPFAVGRFEVTFDDWDKCVSERGCTYSPDHVGWPSGDNQGWERGNRPVFKVSWYSTQTYIRWLSRKTGQNYRLLTEAEWEYMARAGTTTIYNTGNTISEKQANFVGEDRTRLNRHIRHSQIKNLPVDRFPPNGFGIYNIHGGEAEWVQDCWHENYIGAPSDGSAWVTDSNCKSRVIRGGSWNNTYREVRSSIRGHRPMHQSSVSWGFRLARDLP